jgi:hypothetical protein
MGDPNGTADRQPTWSASRRPESIAPHHRAWSTGTTEQEHKGLTIHELYKPRQLFRKYQVK